MAMKAPIRRKQADRRAEAEERLINAATDLIAKRGIEGLRLAELGAIAGFSRALPAHYFGRKEDLIAVIVRRIIDSYQANITRDPTVAPGLGHVIALVQGYIKAMLEHHSNIVALHAVFGSAATNPALLDTVARLNEQSTANIMSSLEVGIGLGEVAPETDTRSEAILLLAFIRGLGAMHLVNRQLPIEKLSSDYLAALVARVAPKKVE